MWCSACHNGYGSAVGERPRSVDMKRHTTCLPHANLLLSCRHIQLEHVVCRMACFHVRSGGLAVSCRLVAWVSCAGCVPACAADSAAGTPPQYLVGFHISIIFGYIYSPASANRLIVQFPRLKLHSPLALICSLNLTAIYTNGCHIASSCTLNCLLHCTGAIPFEAPTSCTHCLR